MKGTTTIYILKFQDRTLRASLTAFAKMEDGLSTHTNSQLGYQHI